MKTALKALVVIVCIGLLIWNTVQLNAIKAGTYEVAIEYGDYVADDAVGEYREATILGLIPFAVEESQQKYGSQLVRAKVVAYYCLAVLEDYSMGAVKLNAVNEQLVGYDEWLLETEEDSLNVLFAEGFTIRGRTVTMPQFDAGTLDSIMSGIYDFNATQEDANEINDSLDGVTLLDATGDYPDTETVVPKLPTLGHAEGFVGFILLIAGLLLAWDLYKRFVEKSDSKTGRKAGLQQQAAANDSAADLASEYARVLIECSSAPVGDPAQAAQYALGKVLYFRSKGLPETDLYRLEISICTNLPAYVFQNYTQVFVAFNQDATPFWAATEALCQQRRLKDAYAISKPLVDYIEQNCDTMVAGKHSFQNIVEDRLYRHVNGYTLKTPVDLTRGYYTGLLVAHAKLIQTQSVRQPELKGTEKEHLEVAQKLSNVSSRAYLHMSKCFEQDEPLWKENIDKALRFCIEKDGAYGLSQIYSNMGLHYMGQDEKLSAACFTLSIHYGNNETTGFSQFLLSKTEAGNPLELKEAVAILRDHQIQVGYSQAVKEVVETLADQPDAQPLIQHILDDNIETYLLQ